MTETSQVNVVGFLFAPRNKTNTQSPINRSERGNSRLSLLLLLLRLEVPRGSAAQIVSLQFPSRGALLPDISKATVVIVTTIHQRVQHHTQRQQQLTASKIH